MQEDKTMEQIVVDHIDFVNHYMVNLTDRFNSKYQTIEVFEHKVYGKFLFRPFWYRKKFFPPRSVLFGRPHRCQKCIQILIRIP